MNISLCRWWEDHSRKSSGASLWTVTWQCSRWSWFSLQHPSPSYNWHDKVSVTHETEVKLLHFNYTKCTQKQKIALAFPVNPKHPDRLLLNDKYNPKYSKISTFHLVKVNSKFSLYNRLNQKIRNIFCLYSLNLKIHDWSLLILPNFYPFTHISISY